VVLIEWCFTHEIAMLLEIKIRFFHFYQHKIKGISIHPCEIDFYQKAIFFISSALENEYNESSEL
jgi:hypothetical protein